MMSKENMDDGRLADLMRSYGECAVSEMYDDLVKWPKSLSVPLVVMDFCEMEGYPHECERFDMPVPACATIGEIRKTLDALATANDRTAAVVSALRGRYEEADASSFVTSDSVGAQLFHHTGYREVVLAEGDAWLCSLRMRYSMSGSRVRLPVDDSSTLQALLDGLLAEGRIRTSYFEIRGEEIGAGADCAEAQ